MEHFAAIGFGYVAQAVAKRLNSRKWWITGTSRTREGAIEISGKGFEALTWNAITPEDEIILALHDVTHILISATPLPTGDPIIRRLTSVIKDLPELCWVGYLSTVGVYGDHDGNWVDEDTEPKPSTQRGELRLAAERAWQDFEDKYDVAAQIFRLPGIYGPGRSPFDRLEAGTARRINKPGQVFNRMHVDDIAGAIAASIKAEHYTQQVLNLGDDLPAPPQDVITYAAELMAVDAPPEVSFDTADMSEISGSFYTENKRVSNEKMKYQLGYMPKYPTYREGLDAIWKNMSR